MRPPWEATPAPPAKKKRAATKARDKAAARVEQFEKARKSPKAEPSTPPCPPPSEETRK